MESPHASRKMMILIVGAVALAGVIILVAVLFARNRQQVGIDAQNLTRAESQLEQTLERCAMDSDPDACRASKVQSAARSVGAVSLCSHLSGEEADNCVWLVARDRENPDDCAPIRDEKNRIRCADDIRVKTAVSSGDAAQCEFIEETDRRERCVALLADPVTSTNCAERVSDSDFCSALTIIEQAKSARNPGLCLQIQNEDRRMGCIDQVGDADLDGDGIEAEREDAYGTSDESLDSDLDGLTDAEEVNVYGTDPADPDTDGDGFSDGSEVQNGYNPNGPGTL